MQETVINERKRSSVATPNGRKEEQASHSKFSNFFYEFMTIFAEFLGHFGTLFSYFYGIL